MKRVGEVIGYGIVLSLALGMTACSGQTNKSDRTKCIGVDFASPKGGPGDVEMRVYPKFDRNFGDARPMTVTGSVESGNDAGKEIIDQEQYGVFDFTWDKTDSSVLSSVVKAQVEFEGHTYTCTPTELQFDPKTYIVTPHLPNSPF